VGVRLFSIGIGPIIKRWKLGDTQYQGCAFPMAGQVHLYDDEDTDVDPDKMINNKPFLAKLVIWSSGSLSNILMGLILLVMVYLFGAREVKTVVRPMSGSPAADVLVYGDEIVEVNGKKVISWAQARAETIRAGKQEVNLIVLRDENKVKVKLVPKKIKYRNWMGQNVEQWMIGVTPVNKIIAKPSLSPLQAIKKSANLVGDMFVATFGIPYIIYQALILEKAGTINISGIPAIPFISAAFHTINGGFLGILYYLAILSLLLGIVNLIPLYMLDGGQILVTLVEAVTKRALNKGLKRNLQHLSWFVFFIINVLALAVIFR
jgi:regulator of sigma E protease